MSDQATLSSFEESFSQINANATTTTTPPLGEYTSNKSNPSDNVLNLNSGSIRTANAVNVSDADFDSLPNVLNSLKLNENQMFTSGFPQNGHAYNGQSSSPPNNWKMMNSWPNTQPGNFNTMPPFHSIHQADAHAHAQVEAQTQKQVAARHHTSSNSTSSKDDPVDVSFTNQNASDSQNNSFLMPEQNQAHDQGQMDSSFLFDQSLGNSPSSALSPNRPINQAFTPVLGDTSRRLNYDQSENDAKSSGLTSELLRNSVSGEALGMGVTPIMNPNDANILGGFSPNQFSFLQPPVRNSSTPPLNVLPSHLMNQGASALNLLPNQLGLGMNPSFLPNGMTIPMSASIPGFQNNMVNPGYGYDFNANLNAIYASGNDNDSVRGNGSIDGSLQQAQNTHGNIHNRNFSASNNQNVGNSSGNGNGNGGGKMNSNNNSVGNGPRNNLGLSSTANVHRKHSSNNKRGEDASRFVNSTLDDFINEIFYLCKDQHGCRFLQRQLEIDGEDAATKIFNEIQLNVIELMIDPFGNYLIQKLLERVNVSQRTTLVKNASSQFVRIALDPHGTRALQKLVECVSTETEFQIIINSLSSYVVLLSRDLNGNHVIQKCLQKLPPDHCEFIFLAACDNCVKIAKHRHGCCVLQRCFDHGTPAQCESLSLKVGENAVELCIDPYGNYVVQYVLSMEENRLRIQNDPESCNKIPDTSKSINFIINSLASHLTKLSTHKFGSNVIEKSLRIPTLAPVLIKKLLNDSDGLKMLLHDAYGNYVLQTSLDVADDSSFKELSEMLKPFLNDVRNTPHGRRILSKLISRGGNSSIYAAAGISNGSGNDFGFENQQFQHHPNHQHHHQHNENQSHGRRQSHGYGNNHYGNGGNGNQIFSSNNNNNSSTHNNSGYNKNKVKYGY